MSRHSRQPRPPGGLASDQSDNDGRSPSPALLSESSRVLHLYTEALAGRRIPLRPTAEAPAILGHSRLDVPTSDGSAIYLPREVDGATSRSDSLAFYKIAILFQLAYYQAGTLAFDLARFTASAEGLQPLAPQSDLGRLFASFERPDLARRLFTLLEAQRIDAHLQRRYKGIRRGLARLKRVALAERPYLADLASSDVALEWLVRFALGETSREAPPAMRTQLGPQVARAIAAECRTLLSSSATVYDSARALLSLYPTFTPPGELESPPSKPAKPVKPSASASRASRSAPSPPVSLAPCDTVIAFHGEMRLDLIQERLALLAVAQSTTREGTPPSSSEPTPIEELRRLLDSDPVGLLSLLDGGPAEAELGNAAGDSPGAGNHGEATPDTESEAVAGSESGSSEGGSTEDIGEPGAGSASAVSSGSVSAQPDRNGPELAAPIRDLAARLARYGSSGEVFHYDEWDHLLAGYRRGWCCLRETSLGEGDRSLIEKALTSHQALLARVKRQFELMRPAAYRKIHRLRDGDEPDLDRVVELVADRRAGLGPPEDIYCRRQRQERDVAAAFLLDMSASTDSSIVDEQDREQETDDQETDDQEAMARDDEDRPMLRYDFVDVLSMPDPIEPAAVARPRRVIDIAKEALVLMAEALEILGDRYAIYGFSGYGRERVDFFVAKEFEAPYDASAQGRIAGMEPKQSTRMGTAIRHTVHKLERQQARQRVLLVISDGYPQDCDYGNDRNSPEYGIRDTMMALREAARRGIHTFCLTIDPAGHDYLREMCPEESYLVIDEVAALPAELPKVYRALTS